MPSRPLSLRIVLLALAVSLVLLQVRLWVSEDGFAEVRRLSTQNVAQRLENAALAERNDRMAAEVGDLKRGFNALEERARSDLGLIGADESFYILGEGSSGD